MVVSWFSGGVSSFIATFIYGKTDRIIYTHIDDQHPDTLRFKNDCERYLKREIEFIQSAYKSTSEVFAAFKFIKMKKYAPCTEVLKRRIRKEFELQTTESLTYIWGLDCKERDRAERLVEANPNQNHIFPLIERNLTKQDCHGMLQDLKIAHPKMYDMGYPNNNCIGCVKGGMGYWNKIRIDFPEVFTQRAAEERKYNSRCLKECFLDELDPGRGNMSTEIFPECSLFCYVESRILKG